MNYRALTAAALAAIIGGSLWYYGSPDKYAEPVEKKIDQPAPREAHGVGLIDIDKIQAAHPEGDHLAQLMATELRLRLELNEAMKIVALPKPQPPATDKEVFDEAAWQKNAQIVISQLADLERRKKLAQEEYRKSSEPKYLAERNKIRDMFANENFNIQLKLKNADHLHLSKEEVNTLLTRLDELELERNKLTHELLERWMADIKKHTDDAFAKEETHLKAEAERLQAVMEEQSRQKESDVTSRNQKLMEDALRDMENRQVRRRELLTELTDVGHERSELEKKILDSIADKATMLAAVYRLEMVLVKRNPSPEEKFLLRHIDWNFELKPPEHVGAAIFPGKDTRDLTDDLIKEMKRL